MDSLKYAAVDMSKAFISEIKEFVAWKQALLDDRGKPATPGKEFLQQFGNQLTSAVAQISETVYILFQC